VPTKSQENTQAALFGLWKARHGKIFYKCLSVLFSQNLILEESFST